MSDLIEYKEHLENVYLTLRSRRVVVCGLEEGARKLALYRNKKIKNRMDEVKSAIKQLEEYITKLEVTNHD